MARTRIFGAALPRCHIAYLSCVCLFLIFVSLSLPTDGLLSTKSARLLIHIRFESQKQSNSSTTSAPLPFFSIVLYTGRATTYCFFLMFPNEFFTLSPHGLDF